MAAQFFVSDYAAQQFLNAMHGTTLTPPANFYIALCSSTPTRSQTGATISELTSAGGYARQVVTFAAASAGGTPGPYQVLNNVVNGSASSGAFSASATAWAILDSATIGAGNLWWFGPLQGTNDVQTVSTSGQLTAGTYTLNPTGTTTVAINYNDTAAQILEKLELAGGVGNFTVAFSGNRFDQATPGTLVITFIGGQASTAETLMTLTPTGITGGTLSIAHTTTGAPGTITVSGTQQTWNVPANNLSLSGFGFNS